MNQSVIVQPAHSSFGFSGWSRLLECLGSHRMQVNTPNPTNPAAEKGTAVHELAERALLTGWDCQDFIGQTFNKFKIDEEMAEAGQVHVNYVRQLMVQMPNAELIVEGRVYLKSISETDIWGTSDIIIIDRESRKLFIGDYKNGYGVVEVDRPHNVSALNKVINGNAQCVGYALATLDTYNLWSEIDEVVTFIVQPNVDHKDGFIRGKSYDYNSLIEWWNAYEATYRMIKTNQSPTKAGKHCKYCRAAGFCKSRITRTMELLQFDNGLDVMKPDQLIELIDEADSIRKSVELLETEVVKLARAGHTVRGKKLVKARTHAYCTDENALVEEALKSNIKKEDLYGKPKLIGMTKMLKVSKKLANKYYEKPPASLKLVPMWDSRTAIAPDEKPDAASAFANLKIK